MKIWKQLTAAMLLVLFFSSCEKIWDVLHGGGGTNKEFRLKEFTRAQRTYTFYYDHAGYVDSVVASRSTGIEYTYRVSHRGRYIDSSSLWQRGELISSRKNVQYNSKGQIKSYTYQLYVSSGSTSNYTHEYNAAGDLYVRKRSSPGPYVTIDTFTYNADRGFKTWIRTSSSSTRTDYTNDNNFNPLSMIHGIEVIFVEEFFDDYWHNNKNSTAEISSSPGNNSNYTNEYDSKQRLIKRTKAGSQPWEASTYTYF